MNSQESVGDEPFHLFSAGGGIIGYGFAGQGLAVWPAEIRDITLATTSASTNRTPGGLCRLDYYAANLVHKALVKREVLWRIALRHRLPPEARRAASQRAVRRAVHTVRSLLL